MERKDKFFGGVCRLSSLPDLVVIVGQPHERNAVLECQKLNIPTITLLDSNCDPSYTTYGIPANDEETLFTTLKTETKKRKGNDLYGSSKKKKTGSSSTE